MKKKSISIFAQAQDQWPEDEAYGIIASYNRRKENEWTASELADGLMADLNHMRKVFSFEADAESLTLRFNAEIKKLMECK